MENYVKLLHQIFAILRQKKYEKDNIDVKESNTPWKFSKRKYQQQSSYYQISKEDLTKNVNMPSYKPFNLTDHQINLHLSELCSKGPSFI